MTKTEVFTLLENLEIIYPGKFVVNEKTVNAFYFHLQDQDSGEVMRNLKQHARTNKFPPTISDLITIKRPYETNPLDKLAEWEAKASGKPSR